MKICGYVLAIFGAVGLLNTIGSIFTKYDLNSTHDLSKLSASLGLGIFLLIGGITMIKKSKPK